MKSTVVVVVDASPREVAKLFADPTANAKWMPDIERCEPVIGKPGMPGSVYRLISKRGSMLFTATVVRRLPDRLQLSLESNDVTVEMEGTLRTLADGRTRLISKEDFKFKGVWNKAYGILAQPTLRKAHRRQIEAFKRFAEQHAQQQKERDVKPERGKKTRKR